MKYTARHVQKFLEQGRISPELWFRHFPTLLPSRVPTCNDCEDFKNSSCKGGKDPVDCFLSIDPESIAKELESDEGAGDGKVKERFRWKGTGAQSHIPAGANKSFDQSKE